MLNMRNTTLAAAAFSALMATSAATAASTADIDRESAQALQMLYKTNPTAEMLSHHAKAILIFPNIVKAGLVFGGAYGEGEVVGESAVKGYYSSFTASWGLQAGAQSYGYAVFLMTNKAVRYLHNSKGWEIGVGPTVVVVDKGVAKNLSTTTLKNDAYAVIFDQQGLMAGVSIEGTKITRVKE